jgi:hypothetical protein
MVMPRTVSCDTLISVGLLQVIRQTNPTPYGQWKKIPGAYICIGQVSQGIPMNIDSLNDV